VLVVYDELDLPFGRIRLRPSGSAGGHNGVASVVRSLGSEAFARLRVGIGRPVSGSTIDYVLSRFSTQERDELDELVMLSADAVFAWLCNGIEPAMNEYNRRTLVRLQRAERGQPATVEDTSR
jgi:PTH1 family peptidyl-tRNA hydrolase